MELKSGSNREPTKLANRRRLNEMIGLFDRNGEGERFESGSRQGSNTMFLLNGGVDVDIIERVRRTSYALRVHVDDVTGLLARPI